MSPTKIPSEHPPSQADLPRCSRDFVNEVQRVRNAGISKVDALTILKCADVLSEYVKLIGLIREIGVDDYVMADLVKMVYEGD